MAVTISKLKVVGAPGGGYVILSGWPSSPDSQWYSITDWKGLMGEGQKSATPGAFNEAIAGFVSSAFGFGLGRGVSTLLSPMTFACLSSGWISGIPQVVSAGAQITAGAIALGGGVVASLLGDEHLARILLTAGGMTLSTGLVTWYANQISFIEPVGQVVWPAIGNV